jgi:hypothetical protein
VALVNEPFAVLPEDPRYGELIEAHLAAKFAELPAPPR